MNPTITNIQELAKLLSNTSTDSEVDSLVSAIEGAISAYRASNIVDLGLVDFDAITKDIGRYDLDYHANDVKSCGYACENDYCRCGRIVSVNDITLQLRELKLPKTATQIQKLLTMRYLNRVFRSTLRDSDFEWQACSGYYGEELEYVRPVLLSYGWSMARKKVEAWNQAKSDNARVELFLMEEYGKVVVPGATYMALDVAFNDIDATEALVASPKMDDSLVRKLRWDVAEGKIDGLLIMKQSNGKYKLIDGRHRYLALSQEMAAPYKSIRGQAKKKGKGQRPSGKTKIKCIAIV